MQHIVSEPSGPSPSPSSPPQADPVHPDLLFGYCRPWLVLSLPLLLATACFSRSAAPQVPLLDRTPPHDHRQAQAVEEARRLYRAGLYDRARTAAADLTAQGCRHPDLLLLQAELAVQATDHAGAVPWCEQAVVSSPLWIEPRILLAQCWLKLERFAAAETVFTDIERLAPRGPWGPYGVAAIAFQRGDPARAGVQVGIALERDPDHLPSLSLAAHLARQAGRADREADLLVRIVQLSPGEAVVWARLGELAQGANRLEDARRNFERAFSQEARPEWAKALADLAQRRNDQDEALRWRRAAGQTAPQDRDLTSESLR